MPERVDGDIQDKLCWILTTLNNDGLAYAVGGAIALAYYVDEPRATHDIDLNVFVPVGQADRVIALFSPHLAFTDESRQELLRDDQVRLLWGETPVDFFFMSVDLHRAMRDARVMVEFQGIVMPILSVTHLVTCKAIFNRTKDWADIETVVTHPDLDKDDVSRWLNDVCGEDSGSYARWVALRGSPPPVPDEHHLPSLKQIYSAPDARRRRAPA